MKTKYIKLFLRFGLGLSFLSAVADRFGWYPAESSTWGNWAGFVEFTAVLNPWMPAASIPLVALVATILEIIFGICLLIGFRTSFFAQLSAWLLLAFALAMTFSIGIKAPLDYSVFSASAASFGLSLMSVKYLEIDMLLLPLQKAKA